MSAENAPQSTHRRLLPPAVELLRPWKLASMLLAMGALIAGSFYSGPTWDIPDSVFMSVLTYLFSPWCAEQFTQAVRGPRRPGLALRVAAALALTYACASGSYELWNWYKHGWWPPPTYWPNLGFSVPVFIAAGLIWRHDGPLRELRPGRDD